MNFAAWLTSSFGMPSPKASLRAWNGCEADGRIDRFLEDLLGRLRGDLFDVHAAGGRGHEDSREVTRSSMMPR